MRRPTCSEGCDRTTDSSWISEHVGGVPCAGEFGSRDRQRVVVSRAVLFEPCVEGIAKWVWDSHSLVCHSERGERRQYDQEHCVAHGVRHFVNVRFRRSELKLDMQDMKFQVIKSESCVCVCELM